MVDVTAGRDGRLAAPPKGDIYRRDPEAARAQAIRERVALFQRQGKPVPDHLQHLYDTLPAHEKLDVDLVDEKSGEQIAEVEVVGPGRSAAPPEEIAPPPGPFSSRSGKPKPEPVATFERYEVPKKAEPEPLEVEAVELPEEEVEPVKPTLGGGSQGGAGTLGAQAEAIARATANSESTPVAKSEPALVKSGPTPPRKQPGRPRKGTPPR